MTRFYRMLLLAAVLMQLLPQVAWTAPQDLFQASVPVASQSGAERVRAAAIGLRQVITRVAGAPGAADAAELDSVYDQAQSYIDQFHYEPYSPEQTQGLGSASGQALGRSAEGATEQLVMSFSRQVVERLLREANLPYWPPNRPKVFVWLVEDVPDQGKVLVNSPDKPVIEGLFQAARTRGLDLQLPLLDLEDQLALPVRALWQLDPNAVLEASERYDVDTVLVGRYSQTSSGYWLSTWQFLHRGTKREYDLRADSAINLGQGALDPLADYLAGLYAITPQGEARPDLVMQLSGIGDFGSYRRALDYLVGLAAVSDVDVHAVRGETLLLHLKAEGGLATIRNAIALDKQLEAADSELDADIPPWLQPEVGTPEHPVAYIWRGR